MSDQPRNDDGTPDDPYATDIKANPSARVWPAAHHPEEAAGDMFGPYKLLQRLGKGGMGVVWMAEQREPVHRSVAVKIIKGALHGEQVIARFEAERQALAMMDHPNIAKILDVGTTAVGGPYFVMELVKGISFTQYCDQEKLTLKDRLELFVAVCNAVQHAHQKGVIHRDLKPSNILIALYDGKPVPKVIDFGVAKATHQKLTEKTMYTEVGQIVGTLEYMAPEQASLNNLDIDTRADIYSLGVVLYEILVGAPPFSAKEMHDAPFDEVLRMIRETEPSKPSTRISSSALLPSIAAKRKVEPNSLARFLRGDLDWIVMKCLEKERARRYETANQLGEELRRYLNDEPVLARPPSVGYRARKFLRRNKGPVVAAALVLLALIGGIIGTSIGFVTAEQAAAQERKAKQIALEAAKSEKAARADAEKSAEKERQARAVAVNRLKQIEKANALLQSIFTDINPRRAEKGGPLLIEQLTKRLLDAADRIDEAADGDPLTVARLQNFMGTTLASLGEPARAIGLHLKARTIFDKLLGPDHAETLSSVNSLAEAYLADDKPGLALPLFEDTLKRRKVELGLDHPDTLSSMNSLASGYHGAGKFDLALPLFEETLKLVEAKLGPNHPNTLSSMNNLAEGYRAAGKLDLAMPLYQDTLKRVEAKFGPNHPDTFSSMNNLALGYQASGKPALAVPLYEDLLKRMKAKLGSGHPNTLKSMSNLAVAYLAVKEPGNAVLLFDEYLSIRRKQWGAGDVRYGSQLAVVALDLLKYGQHAPAEPMLRDCLAIRAKEQPDLWSTFNTKSMLGASLLGQKKHQDAEPLLKEGYEGMKQREKTMPLAARVRLTEALERLVQLYEATNNTAQAERYRNELAERKAAEKAPKEK
jgi:serine/threonine protein kinase